MITNGVTSKTWTPERDAELRALWCVPAPPTVRVIAAQMGLTRNQVIGRARRLKLPRHPGTPTKGGKLPNSGPRKSRAAPRLAPKVPAPPLRVARGQCRWIEGDPAGIDTLFCGAKAERGAYCKTHAARAYIAPTMFTPEQLRASKSLTLGDRPNRSRQT